MKRVLAALLGAVCAFADETVVFRSDVALVRVDAQVVDRDNRALTGLRSDDFILRENGKRQEIRNFATEDMPVDVLLLLDVSGSMRTHVERIAAAAHTAFSAFGRDDRVGVMVFDRATRLQTPLSQDLRSVERELDRLIDHEGFNGGTDITRALIDAARYMGRDGRRDARRAIVVMTDDQTEFDRDEAAVERALNRADTVLSALIAPDAMGWRNGRGGNPRSGGGMGWPGAGGPLGGIILGGGGRRYPRGGGGGPGLGHRTKPAGTSQIAEASGGDSNPVDRANSLEDTLARLRQRYALHFYLPAGIAAGQERDIEVQLADATRRRYPDAQVKYRRTYLAPESSAAGPDAPQVVRESSEVQRDDSKASANNGGFKRRRGVSDGSGGPKVLTSDTPNEAITTAAPSAPAPADNSSRGGWRKAKPEDQPE